MNFLFFKLEDFISQASLTILINADLLLGCNIIQDVSYSAF